MTHELAGADLGTRTVHYTEKDVILYALAVGAAATDLDLVFERRLRVLPTFALTLAQWAPDVLAGLGAWDVGTALHGAQRLEVRQQLRPAGELTMAARVGAVWDKGTAAVFDVVVESASFRATWSIFAPGRGGFGGDRGPGRSPALDAPPDVVRPLATAENQAALYRLTGDRHLIHIDPVAAAAIGQPRPIMHGLCTLAAATLEVARAAGAHPADLAELSGRFAAPVLPGERLELQMWTGETTQFRALRDGAPAVTAGRVRFRVPEEHR